LSLGAVVVADLAGIAVGVATTVNGLAVMVATVAGMVAGVAAMVTGVAVAAAGVAGNVAGGFVVWHCCNGSMWPQRLQMHPDV
jgi:hypothetical protein